MVFLLVESTIFAVRESALGAAGAETSMEEGAGSISGLAADSNTGGVMAAGLGLAMEG